MKTINHHIILLLTAILGVACSPDDSVNTEIQTDSQATIDQLMLTERAIRLANVTWEKVEQTGFRERISLPGKVINDPGLRNPITSRISGRVEKSYLKQPGSQINTGDPVAEVFNPEWSAAVAEFIQLRKEPSAHALFTAAQNRLKRFGFTERQLEEWSSAPEIPRTFMVRAEKPGNIASIEIRQGSYVESGQPIAWTEETFASTVSVRLDPGIGFELAAGMKVEVSGDGWKSTGKIEQVNPANEKGQNFRNARVALANKQSGISPGATVRVHINGPERKAIRLPFAGLVFSGQQAGLFTTTGDGGFRLIPVETGNQQNGLVEIQHGLKGNETVVTSGAYLLYSELVLKNNGNDRLLNLLSTGKSIH